MSGLYLHIPFCKRKCDYCDFFSAPPVANALDDWPRLLQRNLELLPQRSAPLLQTIFFGGGTPSLLEAEQVAAILARCRALFPVAADAEISLEANPATLTSAKLEGYRAAGINRLSLGVQSFDDANLRLLGRLHSAAAARAAFRDARLAGFDNISIDLIFALPGQAAEGLRDEIAALLALAPQHVGIYGLSIEPGTPLASKIATGELAEAEEDLYAAQYQLLHEQLTGAGFEHYEISNFARPGFRCRHNQGYWQRKNCLAAGAGAHGFCADGYGSRYAIRSDLAHYRAQLAAGHSPEERLETFDRRGAMSETLYLALRTSDGLDDGLFARHFGISARHAFPEAFARVAPYLRQQGDSISFTPEGWLIYDHLISHFL